MSAEHFAGRLRELRDAAGLSQEQLAERSGLKPGAIRDLEQGRNCPRWGTVLQLAEALGVSDLREFARAPATQAQPRRGRPRQGLRAEAPEPQGHARRRKTPTEASGASAERPAVKQPRGRPSRRKGK